MWDLVYSLWQPFVIEGQSLYCLCAPICTHLTRQTAVAATTNSSNLPMHLFVHNLLTRHFYSLSQGALRVAPSARQLARPAELRNHRASNPQPRHSTPQTYKLYGPRHACKNSPVALFSLAPLPRALSSSLARLALLLRRHATSLLPQELSSHTRTQTRGLRVSHLLTTPRLFPLIPLAPGASFPVRLALYSIRTVACSYS